MAGLRDDAMNEALRVAARTDAKLFAEEFPGEALTGDWDAEAWAERCRQDTDIAEANRLEDGAGWELYHERLHAEVDAILAARGAAPRSTR